MFTNEITFKDVNNEFVKFLILLKKIVPPGHFQKKLMILFSKNEPKISRMCPECYFKVFIRTLGVSLAFNEYCEGKKSRSHFMSFYPIDFIFKICVGDT